MYTKIKAEIKEAMKTKDTIKRDALKMVVDKAKSIKKETHPNDTTEIIPDDMIVTAVNKEIKQLNQTKDSLKGKEDSNLYKETEIKIAILSTYLPKMMTKEEVEKAVESILSTGEYSNFGARMKVVMSELRGKADNKVIKEAVESFK